MSPIETEGPQRDPLPGRKHKHKPVPSTQPAWLMRPRGEGVLVRLAPIKHVTPKTVISHRIWLPAVLNNLTITEDAMHNEYDTISAGQFSQPAAGGEAAPRLKAIDQLETLVIDFDPEWIVASGQNPAQLRALLYKIHRSKKPVHMLITFHPHPYPHPELSDNITFRSISRELRSGESETRYLTLAIKQWRDAHVQRRKQGHKKKPLPTTHKLTKTDTLRSLAYKYYGGYAHWRAIRDANKMPKKMSAKEPIVKLGGRFKVGAKIKIPLVPGVDWQSNTSFVVARGTLDGSGV